MPVSYTWTFPQLDVIYSTDGYQNVVRSVHWVQTATDGSHSATVYGSANLAPPGPSFINYSDLTPEIVQGWVEAALGSEQLASLTATLLQELDSQQAPTGGLLPPPWQA